MIIKTARSTRKCILQPRKEKYYATKQLILDEIRNIYHENNVVVGYRMMKAYLECKGIKLSDHTLHKYMNTELGLFSIVRRKKTNYHYARVVSTLLKNLLSSAQVWILLKA